MDLDVISSKQAVTVTPCCG